MRSRSIRYGVPLDELGVPFDRLGVPPCGRAYFLLLRQKKVAKEKATPGYAVGCADSPALLEAPGTPRVLPRTAAHCSGRGCGTRPCGPQTVLAEGPRPFEQHRAVGEADRVSWGRLFFGYFLLAKQKKVCPPVSGGKQRIRKPRSRIRRGTQRFQKPRPLISGKTQQL